MSPVHAPSMILGRRLLGVALAACLMPLCQARAATTEPNLEVYGVVTALANDMLTVEHQTGPRWPSA